MLAAKRRPLAHARGYLNGATEHPIAVQPRASARGQDQKHSRLERDSERQLYFARTIGNVQDSPERGRTQIVIRIAAPGPVKCVDHVAAELHESRFTERKPFEEAEVLRGISGTAKITEESRRVPQG